ncbi:magnesium transporter CorA family protein [Lapidilactobacillus mulanensis]|uniref:Magnesium transporter CorA family protein n=1 Tax=Lapidilactobacillus mulanensis TaxID=2485999 RepID=A0ABW4DRX5_9LACO|nr:magnesium transporter CorA family protein [Lapidilactobacillus mulanensis]
MIRVNPYTQANNQVIEVTSMDDQDRQDLKANYHLTDKFLAYAADPVERARVEYNEFTETWIIVYNVPLAVTGETHHVIQPVSLIIHHNQLIVFVTERTKFILKEVTSLTNQDQTQGVWDSVLDLLYQVTTDYFDYIQQMSEVRAHIEEHLHHHSSSKQIFALADLSKNQTYFLTGANGNLVAISQLRFQIDQGNRLKLDQQTSAHLAEIEIEARQAQEMLELNTDMVDKISNTYNNLLNNNLNNVMKILTIYSVVLMIPPIIFGFYGMNTYLPFAEQNWGWIFSIVITIIPSVFIIYKLKHDHFL